VRRPVGRDPPRVVSLGKESTIGFGRGVRARGLFCAPNALLQLNEAGIYAGKLVARTIQGGTGNAIVCPDPPTTRADATSGERTGG
jgi:hypothetical protein